MAIKFNETLAAEAYFQIDDKSHNKRHFDADIDPVAETVGIYPIKTNGVVFPQNYLVIPVIYSEWTNQAGTPYASFAALEADLQTAFFF